MKKTVRPISIGLLAVISLPLLYAYLAYPAEYVNRVLRWGNADVYDYRKFPERLLDASSAPFEFSLNLDEERLQLALKDTQIVGLPGKQFHYNNYHPLLLGMILERATGTSVTNYLQEKIWKPIGMEYPSSWSLDENGFEKMESGINAQAIDFAKFGRLFLNGGDWNGVQAIPAEWVVESTRAESSVDYANYYYDDFIFSNGQDYYKNMWWGLQRDEQNYDFMALGNHGQFIYISPQKNLIILRFGESYGDIDGADEWVELFHKFASSFDE